MFRRAASWGPVPIADIQDANRPAVIRTGREQIDRNL